MLIDAFIVSVMDCLGIFDQCLHAASSTTVSSSCPKCGITTKSGKISCCGRGGSWFGDCGSGGDTKFGHTWYDGLQSCRAWSESKAVIVQQLNEAEQQRDGSSEDTAAKPHTLTSLPELGARPIVVRAYTPQANMSPATRSMATAEMPNTSSASVIRGQHPDSILMTTVARTPPSSQGRAQVTGVTFCMTLSLIAVSLAH